jgi:hypothetical protein
LASESQIARHTTRRVRIKSESHDLIAGFVAGVEWVNDSAIAVVDLDYRGQTAFVVLEDLDGAGEDKVLRLTSDGIAEKE